MTDIRRFNVEIINGSFRDTYQLRAFKHSDGEFVYYVDHEAIVNELRQQIEVAKNSWPTAYNQTVDDLRKERDQLAEHCEMLRSQYEIMRNSRNNYRSRCRGLANKLLGMIE
jgi:uncharacterized protein YdcH (DUF465 family)